MMKTLKLLLVIFVSVFCSGLAEAGLADRFFLPILRHIRGGNLNNVLGGAGSNNIFQFGGNPQLNLQFNQFYTTYYQGDEEQDDQDVVEEVLIPGEQPSFGVPSPNAVPVEYDPYCPHQAGWPGRVARGEIRFAGGSVFSDMLQGRYLHDQTEGLIDSDDEPEKDEDPETDEEEDVVLVNNNNATPLATMDIALERTGELWVQRIFDGQVPLVSPGIMGEQVLDLASMESDDEDEMDTLERLDAQPLLSDMTIDNFVSGARFWGWDIQGLRSFIEGAVDDEVDTMTGYVDLDVIELYFSTGVIQGYGIIEGIHAELEQESVDAMYYKSVVNEVLGEIEKRLDDSESRLL